MGACPRLNTRLRITCRPGGPSSGWIVTLTGRSGGLGFFSTSRSATLVVNSLWRGAELGHYQLGERESSDHWVRNQEEWQRIAAYIENNPVKAGVVSQAEEYRWASAHATWRAKLDPPSVGTSADVARKSACSTDTVRDP